MPEELPIYSSHTLYGIMYDRRVEAPSTYWLNLCFGRTIMFETEDILFEKLSSTREIAPFVLPTVPGKPTYRRRGSEVRRFRPAYIKPKDAVRPAEQIYRQPGDLFTATPKTPKQRFDAEVVNIAVHHRNIITRRWEWMAAKAILDGQVTVEGDGYPTVVVDFGRDSGHTITKTGGSVWTENYDIYGDIQSWMDQMASAKFGGIPNRMTIGTDVWAVMRKNKYIREQMDTQVRGNDTNLPTGLIRPASSPSDVRYLGTLGGGLEVWLYVDYYEQSDGTTVPFMNPKDVVLTAPGVDGVKAFGAILDAKAGLQATDIFSKMFDDEDPSARFILSQSAPLMVPVNPNCTLRARVLE